MSDTETIDQEPESEDYYSADDSEQEEYSSDITLPDGNTITQDEFYQVWDKFNNDNKWREENRKRSEAINNDKAQWQQKQSSEQKRLADRENKIRQKEMQFQKRVSDHEKLTYNEKLARHSDFKLAAAQLMREYPDLDHEQLTEWVKQYNFDISEDSNPRDLLQFAYWAWKGSQIEDLLRDARADVVREAKTKKGTPQVSGPSGSVGPPRTFEDAARASRLGLK